jgi:hypothetical protein
MAFDGVTLHHVTYSMSGTTVTILQRTVTSITGLAALLVGQTLYIEAVG